MHFSSKAALSVAILAGITATAAQAAIVVVGYTDDTNVDIDPSKTYTHTVDFNGEPTASQNVGSGAGVDFDAVAQIGTSLGNSYSLTAPDGPLAPFPDPNSDALGIDGLTKDFFYNGDGGDETVTISGLLTGQAYDLRFYTVPFGAGGRTQNVFLDNGAADQQLLGYDQDGNGIHYLSITYVAQSGSVSVLFDDQDSNASYHQYGFTNEVVPEPASLSLLGLGAAALIARRRRI